MANKKSSANRVRKPSPAKNGKAESLVARAKRILSGDVHRDDYLPVDAETVAFVDSEEKQIGIRLLPEARRVLITELILQAHHAGENVLTHHTPEGVFVLAVGLDDANRVSSELTPQQQSLTRLEIPAEAFDVRPPVL